MSERSRFKELREQIQPLVGAAGGAAFMASIIGPSEIVALLDIAEAAQAMIDQTSSYIFETKQPVVLATVKAGPIRRIALALSRFDDCSMTERTGRGLCIWCHRLTASPDSVCEDDGCRELESIAQEARTERTRRAAG